MRGDWYRLGMIKMITSIYIIAQPHFLSSKRTLLGKAKLSSLKESLKKDEENKKKKAFG